MSYTKSDRDKALQGYAYYALVLDPEDLREFYEDGDFADLCTLRLLIEEDYDLNVSEEALVRAADAQLAAAFDPQTLQIYANYFSDMPIEKWWGGNPSGE